MNHEKEKAEFVKNHLTSDPKQSKFKVGDLVGWINCNGVEWEHKILGFNYVREYNETYKKFIHLDTDSYWFPHGEEELTLIK